jgi:hypothetical protein
VVVDAAVGGKRNKEEDVEMYVVVEVVGDEAGGLEMDTVAPVEGEGKHKHTEYEEEGDWKDEEGDVDGAEAMVSSAEEEEDLRAYP